MNEPKLIIGEVARQAGLRSSAIRYYEEIGVLPTPERTYGHRRYSSRVFQQLACIQLAQAAGFSMAQIRTLVSGFDETAPLGVRWRTLAEQKLAELDILITRAQGMKQVLEEGIRCQCLNLDECLPVASRRCL
ncbi:MAG TPA: MerR family transcriptional regulator [Ktedonobacteraceae bacterium]|nr:MerR family transcriptional regulator [Ktedonobacteraceae bacterium]